MATITMQPVTDKAAWEAFLATRSEASFLQSWYWGVFQENIGKAIARVGLYADEQLVGVMLSVQEDAKRGRYLTVPGGPIIDWHDHSLVEQFMTEITRQAKEQRCSFVRVRPQLEEDAFSRELFTHLGFVQSPMHLGAEVTHQLDISATEEELLMHMRKSTRYEIKKATTDTIKITASTDPKDIQVFYDTQLETAQRQNFTPFSYAFLHAQFAVFASAGNAILYTAYHKDVLLAHAFIIFYGEEGVYHYAASTEAGRKYPGAYALQWEAIKEAKRRGLKRYNFWGVADDPNHRYYSLSIFKRGFGGYDFTYLHAHDLIINPLRYSINFAIENVRKRVRKL